MQARMRNVAAVVPEVLRAFQAVGKATEQAAQQGGVPTRTLELIHLRVSQINGCSVCLDGHWRALQKEGETMERLMTLAGWRDTPYFTDAERAALALAEAATRLADRTDAVPDEIWDEAAKHYDEVGLAALLLAIASINVWNRLNVATRQVAGGGW